MKPLTIEQLRGMDGQCVKIFVGGVEPLEMLALVKVPKEDPGVLLSNNLGGAKIYSDNNLREDGIKVYAYYPAHIDREAWKAEWREFKEEKLVGMDDVGNDKYRHYHYFVCTSCGKKNVIKTNFCPVCGKAMTQEAWEDLEKRFKG